MKIKLSLVHNCDVTTEGKDQLFPHVSLCRVVHTGDIRHGLHGIAVMSSVDRTCDPGLSLQTNLLN